MQTGSFLDFWRAIVGPCVLSFDKGGDVPAAPPAPDPANIVRAQAAATPSARTPFGSRIYSGDPNVPGSFGYSEQFSPALQQQFEATNRLRSGLQTRAEGLVPQLPGGTITPNMNDPAVQQYWQAQKGLLDEAFGQQGEAQEQRLANQGLPMGSEAYTEEMDRFERGRSKAYEQAAAGALGQGFNMGLQSRQQGLNEIAQAMGGQLSPINAPASTQVDPTAAQQLSQAGKNTGYQGQVAAYNAEQAAQQQALQSAAMIAAMFLL